MQYIQEHIRLKTTLERLYEIKDIMTNLSQELSDLVETTEMELGELRYYGTSKGNG